ncbi:MAG TPA: SpoIIE family protein phosphatase, partial [bacterium]|nr:SpoIIE family protein phosphatase [bacterium]
MSSKPDPPRQWRLGTSLTVSLVLLLAVVIFLTFVTYRNILSERRQAEMEGAVAIARTLGSEVDRVVNDLETTTLTLALFLGNESISLDQAGVGTYLRRVLESYGFMRALFVTDLQARVIVSATGEGIGTDLVARPYMRTLRTGARSAWSDSLSGIQSGQVTVAFGRVIQWPDGRTRAYLVAAFYPARLVTRLQATLPPEARTTLIDSNGIVMHTTYVPILPPDRRDVSSFEPVKEALAGRIVRVSGQGLPFSSDARFGAMVPVASRGWVVSYSRPLQPLEARIRRPAVEQAVLLTLAVILVGLVFGLIARRLTRPLVSLADTAAEIARGERPDIPEVSGVVETSQLAAGMRTMARAVAEREDRLRGTVERERSAREDAERAHTRMSFLTEVSGVLAGSLDYEETLRNVARLAVPRYADWCSVDLVGEDGKIERLAVTHVDPAKIQLAYEIERRYPQDPDARTGIPEVVRTGEAALVRVVTDEMLQAAAKDPEHLQVLRQLGIVSAIIAPLTVRGLTFGTISFVWAESGRTYSEEDQRLALELARRAAVAIDNARLYRRERSIAETLQRSLLRKHLPEFPGMAIASRYLPARQEAEVGGDWYDALALPDGRVGLVMGDVAGRGIQAAAVMGQLQNAVRAYAMEGHAPAVILERVTRLMDLREMATLLYLVFDPPTWTVQYANAGHLPPMVISPDGKASLLLEGGSPPIGSAGEVLFKEERVSIAPGSTIVLYTDGLVEVRGEPIDQGLDRLVRAASGQPPDQPEALLDHVLSTMLGREAGADDVALLALHATLLDPSHLRLRLDAVPASMPLLRHTIRRWLDQARATSAEIFEITVAASEAFSNAIEHAYAAADGQIEVEGELRREDLTLTVRDWGRWRQPRGTNRGRGLSLMRGLMDNVKVTPE